MIHSILLVQFSCLTVFLNNLSPRPLWSTSWSGAIDLILHTFLHQTKSLLFTTHAHTITTCFAVVPILYHLFLVSLSTLHLELYSIFYLNVTHPSDHSHLCSLKCHRTDFEIQNPTDFDFSGSITYHLCSVCLLFSCMVHNDVLLPHYKAVLQNGRNSSPMSFVHLFCHYTSVTAIATKPEGDTKKRITGQCQ